MGDRCVWGRRVARKVTIKWQADNAPTIEPGYRKGEEGNLYNKLPSQNKTMSLEDKFGG